jgi:hypothetical protein
MSTSSTPFSIELDAKTKKIMSNLYRGAGAVSLKASLIAIGISYRKEVKGIFERKQVRDPSLRWPDITIATDKAKTRAGFGSEPILVRTGKLKKSMTIKGSEGNIDEVGHDYGFFGSSIPYGNYHDNLDEPRHKMPLRNFSQPSESTYKSWLNTISTDLINQLARQGIMVE